MKTIHIHFGLATLLFCSLAAGLFAQTPQPVTWQPLNGPHGGSVLSFASDSNGYIYAGAGYNDKGLYRSDDGGLTWLRISNGIPLGDRTVDCIIIADSGHILIGTNSHIGSFFYRSADQGRTWIESIRMGAKSFTKNSEGNIFAGGTEYGAIHISSDNGHSWERIQVPLGQVDEIAINEDGHIFIVGWSMYRSTDNGENWVAITSGLTDNVRSIAIDGNGHLYAGSWGEYASNSGIFKSVNNGDSWFPVKPGFRVNSHHNIAISKQGYIFVGSWGSGIWKSVDEGETWTQQNQGLEHLYMRYIHIAADGIILAGTDAGGMYRSADDGETWQQVGLPVASVKKMIINPINGDIFAAVNGVSLSSDAGTTWQPVNSGLGNLDVRSLTITPDGTLFAGGAGGGYNPPPPVYRSVNNGESWVRSDNGIPNHSVEAMAVDDNGSVYAGNYYGVFRTDDNGSNWVNIGEVSGAKSLEFNTAGDLFLASWGQGLWKLPSGDTTWVNLTANIQASWIWTLFIDSNDYIFTADKRSTDGGETWTSLGSTGHGASSYAENALGHLFCGTMNFGSGIFRSLDHGDTWESVNTGMPGNDTRAMVMDADGYLYAAPLGYSVYKTAQPTTLLTSIGEASDLPARFELEQNWPNPFNPATNIRFTIPATSYVSLAVYDVLGRQVEVIVSDELQAGTHNFAWNATRFASGIYMYRLQSGSEVQTRKLVLVK
jgi:photosystem II stability/assembly factor-like uncharacterized protein